MFTCVVFGSLVAVSVISGGLALTEEEREIVLSAHNEYRSILAKGQAENPNGTFLPPGSSIYALTYNPEIEAMAQEYANNCQFKHTTSEQRKGTGENLYNYGNYKINNTFALKNAADSWWAELGQYGFYSEDQVLTGADFDSGIGHWSQMAWEKTREIGCGIAHCPSDKCGIISCGMTLVVCNYYPPGNYIDQRVYISGAPCSETSGCVNTPASTCNTSSNLCEEIGGLEFPPVLTTPVAPPNSGKCTAQLKSCTRGSCNCGCTINGGVNTDTSNSTCKAWVTKCTDNSCGCNCSTGSG